MQIENTIFIHSNICSNGNGDDILQEIYMNNSVSAPFSSLTWMNTDPITYGKRLNTNKSNTFSFTITDENNNEINFNGRNILFTLLLYEESEIFNKISLFLDYMASKYLE